LDRRLISRDVIILIGYLSLFLLTQQLMEIRPSAISKAADVPHLLTLPRAVVAWRSEALVYQRKRGKYSENQRTAVTVPGRRKRGSRCVYHQSLRSPERQQHGGQRQQMKNVAAC